MSDIRIDTISIKIPHSMNKILENIAAKEKSNTMILKRKRQSMMTHTGKKRQNKRRLHSLT